jgi:hypothetical protein
MSQTHYVLACAGLDELGIHASGRASQPWQEGQSGPADVQRGQVYELPLPTFGKLLLAEKLAFSLASLILGQKPPYQEETTGISLGSRFGSFSTDLRFMGSITAGFPRPAYFAATLPSSPVAEAAIQYKLKGPNRVFCNQSTAGLDALDAALTLLRLGKAETMLVLFISGLEAGDSGSPLLDAAQLRTAFGAGLLIANRPVPGRPCFRVSLEGDFRKNLQAQQTGESYFVEAVRAMAAGKDFSSPISAPHFNGKVAFVKEA